MSTSTSPGGRARPLRVLHVASEVAPWSQTGGLGEVVGALPDAVARAAARTGDDVHVTLVTPLHRGVAERIGGAGLALGEPRHHTVTVGATRIEVQLRPLYRAGHVTIWFVDAPHLYDREGVYAPRGGGDHPDNPLRFAVLCRVAAALAPNVPGVYKWGMTAAGIAWMAAFTTFAIVYAPMLLGRTRKQAHASA